MKFFKTMTAVALLVMGTTAMAQGQGNHPNRSATERATNETERVAKSLELNAEQTVKVQVINYKYAVKDSIRFEEMRKENPNVEKPDRETMMKMMKEARAAKATEVKALLTDDQKVKYEAILKERENRAPRQGGNGNHPEGAPAGGM